MKKELIVGIYKLTNIINNKVYIGQSNNIHRRWKEYRSKYNREKTVIGRALNKYGLENFTFEIIEECSVEELDEREIFWIKHYNSWVKAKDSHGYNVTQGGGGMRGYSLSEESRRKISKSLSGENHPKFGGTISEEQKLAISRSQKGKIVSKESREKMSKSKQGMYVGGNHPKAKKVICEGKVFDCVLDCSIHYNVSYGAMKNWMKGRNGMPQFFLENNLRYLGDETTVYKLADIRNKSLKVCCEGELFETTSACAEYYGVKKHTMQSWLSGRRPMPERFTELGLSYDVAS